MSARFWTSWAIVTAVLAAVACGADNLVAPRLERSAVSTSCRSFEALVPNFMDAIGSGRTAALRDVVEKYLLQPDGDSHVPAVNEVLRVVFNTIAGFAQQPAEADAAPGELCAEAPPSFAESNPLCELRRSMDAMVHQAKGLEALRLAGPYIAAALDYLNGRAPSAGVPHYEVAQVIGDMCQQTGKCQLSDSVDLVIALTALIQTDEGRAQLDRFDALVNHPDLQPYLLDNGQQYGGEAGFVALTSLVTDTVIAMDDPSDLDAIPTDVFPPNLQPLMKGAIVDLESMLSATRNPNLLSPMKKVLGCMATKDSGHEMSKMVYRLGFETPIPELSVQKMIHLIRELKDTDPRGTLVHMLNLLATSFRQDDEAINSAAKVCAVLFSTDVPPGETQSNAARALPVIADLHRSGVVNEVICAADTLIFGCAGGPQPACAP